MRPLRGNRSVRRGLVAVVAIAAAVGLAGCDRPSVAAYVGGSSVSASSINKLVTTGLAEPGMSAAWGSKQATYRKRLLSNEIFHLQTAQAAARYHVSVSESELASVTKSVQASQLAALGVAPSQVPAFLRDVALAGEVAAASKAIASQYFIGLIGVRTPAEARALKVRVRANPDNYSTIAKAYKNSFQDPTGIDFSQLAQAISPQQLGLLSKGSTTVVSVSTQGGGSQPAVVHVFDVKPFQLATMTAAKRLQTVIGLYPASRVSLNLDSRAAVRVNPRFGSWNKLTGEIGSLPNSALLASGSSG
ncbi:MAG: hypothetical protein ACR2JQ_07065 [Mycobacteriales bacterium]